MRHRIAFFTVGMTFLALFMGVLVTSTGSGDACGTDWPGCNGSLFPSLTDYKQVIEYTHRLVVGVLGFILLFNAIYAWMKRYPMERAVMLLAPLSLLLLLLQALVGGFNVMLGTPPGFTTIDVAVSLALFSSLLFLATALMRKGVTEEEMIPQNGRRESIFSPALLLLLLFYTETAFGAFFKHSAAAEVYMGIQPLQQLITSKALSQFLYLLHWIFAFVVFFAALRLLFLSWRFGKEKAAATLMAAVIVLEMGMGFVTVLTHLASFSVAVHMILASTGVGLSSYIVGRSLFGETYLIHAEGRRRTHGPVHDG